MIMICHAKKIRIFYLFTLILLYSIIIIESNDKSQTGDDRPISEFKINDEWIALPEVFSLLDFHANSSFPNDDDIIGQQELRSSRFWGRIYIPGWPQTIQYYRAHFGIKDPPQGLTRLIFPDPRDGCTEFTDIDKYFDKAVDNLSFVVVVDRGTCTFGTKSKIASQIEWLSGIIVINNEPGLDHLPGPDAHDIDFSVMSISQLDGLQMSNYVFNYQSSYLPIQSTDLSNNLKFIDSYIVPISCDKKQQLCQPATVAERNIVSNLPVGGLIETKLSSVPVEFLLAKFGVKLVDGTYSLSIVKPIYACGNITNPQSVYQKIVLVKRGGCSFYDKAINIQQAKGSAMLLANDKEYITRMGVEPRVKGLDIEIPLLMVSNTVYSYLATEYYLGNNITVNLSSEVSESEWFEIEKLYPPLMEWPRSEVFIKKKYEEMKQFHLKWPDRIRAIEEAYRLKINQAYGKITDEL